MSTGSIAQATRSTGQRNRGGGVSGAIRAEWVKLWSVRSPYVCLTAGVVVTAIFTFYYGSIARINDQPLQPVGNASAASLLLVQFTCAVLAMLTVTGEYATGSVRASLLWVPVRQRVQLAKTVVAAAVTFAAGALFGVLGIAVAWVPFRGHATFQLASTVGQVTAMGVYCALIAATAVGVSFLLRASAGALTVLFILIAAVPSVLTGLGGDMLLAVNDVMPQTAGMHLMRAGADAPYTWPVALLIVLSWTVAAYLAGSLRLRSRDA
ncbi:ABC transporter permease [Streptomyces sp. NPDC052164]|uniref:ABC transporter permease n=1 Tax=Streptomyces sp. NPDC052164 TaxID=3155529 RepID=UPI003428D243